MGSAIFRTAVLNLPPSSSHSLAGEAQHQKRRKRKVQEAEASRKEKTQWGFLTSLGLISSSSFPHFVLHGGVLNVFLLFFVSFFQKLFYVGRLLPFQAVLGTAGRNARRHRDTESVGCATGLQISSAE